MLHYFLNVKIRIKLLLAFGSLLLLSSALVYLFFQIAGRLETYQTVSEEIDQINLHVVEMDATAKYFLFEGYKSVAFQHENKSPSLEVYMYHKQKVLTSLDSLAIRGISGKEAQIASVKRAIVSLDANVKLLVSKFKEHGFKDYGLEGALRRAIHQVENSPLPIDKVEMLMLRRHEKDFFLRKDIKYLTDFVSRCERLEANIENSASSPEQQQLLKELRSYKNLFVEVVKVEESIGLTEDSGLKGEINKTLSGLKEHIYALRTQIKDERNALRQNASLFLGIVFMIQLGLGVVLAIAYSHVITRAIKELQRSMKSLANGVFPGHLPVKSEEEIGQTKRAFNQLLDRIKAATEFSESLGQGQRHRKYDERFTTDVFAQSLVALQQQLARSAQQQEITHWTTYGLAQLSDILKGENESIEQIGDRLLKFLINYLPANQGALYVVTHVEGNDYIDRIASFAYGKKKFVEQRIAWGEGLVGQCLEEEEPIVLTQVPADFVKITSGLGEALPRFVAIYPLTIHGELLGAIELASFNVLEKYKLEFLQKISENMAAILLNKRVTNLTKDLLAQTKERERQLALKEEELRQNAEEMKAVQEQMAEQQRRTEKELTLLKAKVFMKEARSAQQNKAELYEITAERRS